MSDNVVCFRGGLSRAAAERRIREIAADTSVLDFPWSAAGQMAAAEITMRQVVETLRSAPLPRTRSGTNVAIGFAPFASGQAGATRRSWWLFRTTDLCRLSQSVS